MKQFLIIRYLIFSKYILIKEGFVLFNIFIFVYKFIIYLQLWFFTFIYIFNCLSPAEFWGFKLIVLMRHLLNRPISLKIEDAVDATTKPLYLFLLQFDLFLICFHIIFIWRTKKVHIFIIIIHIYDYMYYSLLYILLYIYMYYY